MEDKEDMEYCNCNGVKFFASGCESGLQCAKCMLVTKPSRLYTKVYT